MYRPRTITTGTMTKTSKPSLSSCNVSLQRTKQYRGYVTPQQLLVPFHESPASIPELPHLLSTRKFSFQEYRRDTKQALHEIRHSSPLMAPPKRKRNLKQTQNSSSHRIQEEDEIGKEEHQNIIMGSWLDSFY
eukprot:gb/GECH01011321.1/.p1 GENE.gb/GECH01011321.1/~~gb/GECH01011321.1/.p1  ORF type:complete len:133 (+),score=28.03 gb/GECH01011321.1/:1-399(+)